MIVKESIDLLGPKSHEDIEKDFKNLYDISYKKVLDIITECKRLGMNLRIVEEHKKFLLFELKHFIIQGKLNKKEYLQTFSKILGEKTVKMMEIATNGNINKSNTEVKEKFYKLVTFSEVLDTLKKVKKSFEELDETC